MVNNWYLCSFNVNHCGMCPYHIWINANNIYIAKQRFYAALVRRGVQAVDTINLTITHIKNSDYNFQHIKDNLESSYSSYGLFEGYIQGAQRYRLQ